MNSIEPALRAVRVQEQFAVAELAAEVAQAATRVAQEQNEVDTLQQRCDSAAGELRAAMARAPINPAVIGAMHRLHHAEHDSLRNTRMRLATAQEHERRSRAALADARNRERSLERALNAERRKQQMKQQAREIIEADERWLQHAPRASS